MGLNTVNNFCPLLRLRVSASAEQGRRQVIRQQSDAGGQYSSGS
jgi:hypothetical protein